MESTKSATIVALRAVPRLLWAVMPKSARKPKPAESARVATRAAWSRGWWAALVPVYVLLATLSLRQLGSLDMGFHLKAGEHILSGAGWPRNDPFTYTVNDHAYIDTSWGYQVAVASLQNVWGAPGIVVFHAGLVLATFTLVILTIRLCKVDPLVLLLFLFIAVLASEMRFEARPELLSYSLLALVLYLLHRHVEGRSSPLWSLPAIFLLWANSHSLFVLGWGALASFVLGSWLRQFRLDRKLALVSVVSVAIATINPYGLDALTFPFSLTSRFADTNVFGQTIGEFLSPWNLRVSEQNPFYPWTPIASFRVLVVLVVLSLIPLARQRRWWCVLLAAPFLYLSCAMIRNMPLLAVACGPGVVWSLSSFMPVRARGGRVRALAGVAIAAAALVVALRVHHDAYYIASRREDRFGVGWNRAIQPGDAARYAERTGLAGRMLNHLNFGGYLMWALPEPVFIDGRLEVIGERFYEQYREVFASEPALESCVARYGVGWLVFPYKTAPELLRRVSRDARWRLTYFDDLAALFVRQQDGVDEVVDEETRQALRVAPARVEIGSLPGLGGQARIGRAARFLAGLWRREVFPGETYSRGLFHFFRGDLARAAPLFGEAIRSSGGAYYETYNNLGAALYRLGRHEEAAACYRVVLAEAPANRVARERLAQIESTPVFRTPPP